jgi:GTPase
VAVPQVVIIGRPNVGKSSLFNWLARRRLAIVDDFAGVTRDRVSTLIEHAEKFFELVDTGGIGGQDADDLDAEVNRQIEIALDSANLVLFVVDSKSGLTPLDQDVAERLRSITCPVILVANKTDNEPLDPVAEEFRKLGRGHLVKVSTLQNRGREDLMRLICEWLPPSDGKKIVYSKMKVAIVGRRNVGKSTFVNSLARADRMIVSEVPGTTRDSVDVHFELDGQQFTAIDTPGLRKMKSVRTDLEFYSTHRAQRSIRRADVVLMFFDGSEKISKVDKQLVGYIAEEYKPIIFVVNKWDTQHDSIPTERWVHYIHNEFPTFQYAPIAFITGKTGKNVKALLNHAQMLFKQSQQRVNTGQLNRLVKLMIEKHPPPIDGGRRPKIYYGTQVAVQPPTVVLMCNNPKSFPADYRRYLLGIMRDHTPFGEVPIKLYLHQREHGDDESES